MSNTKTKTTFSLQEKTDVVVTLATIQSEVKATKNNFNAFGKYKYRSAEDIIEAVKPVIHKYGYWLIMNDDVVLIGERFYIKSTITLTNGVNTYTSTAFAREEETKKGMDQSQITGASSSYSRKYCLAGLFALDNDTSDSDATNTHDSNADVKSSKQVNATQEKALPEMNDDLMIKLIARYNGGEKDVFDKAQKHYALREKDFNIIKNLNNDNK
jgi:hypothetical protein